mgnify:CR=1 FL=1
MQFLSHSTQETEAIGEELAQKLCGGDVLAFTGSLGMGKTAFTRGLAREGRTLSLIHISEPTRPY